MLELRCLNLFTAAGDDYIYVLVTVNLALPFFLEKTEGEENCIRAAEEFDGLRLLTI